MSDCKYYKKKLELANLEIAKLQAYNSAAEDTLLDIEVRFDQRIRKLEKNIQVWKEVDPNCDTTCMESHLLLLKKFRKEIFKNEMSSEK